MGSYVVVEPSGLAASGIFDDLPVLVLPSSWDDDLAAPRLRDAAARFELRGWRHADSAADGDGAAGYPKLKRRFWLDRIDAAARAALAAHERQRATHGEL